MWTMISSLSRNLSSPFCWNMTGTYEYFWVRELFLCWAFQIVSLIKPQVSIKILNYSIRLHGHCIFVFAWAWHYYNLWSTTNEITEYNPTESCILESNGEVTWTKWSTFVSDWLSTMAGICPCTKNLWPIKSSRSYWER